MVDKANCQSCRRVSADHAVMEKTEDAVVASLDTGWSDIGSSSSL
jgi:mannose-1-phosphate guanylyltransferase